MLYQREDGALDLHWRLDPDALGHARSAFAADTDPAVVLLLKRADGDRGPIASARLDAEDGLAPGSAHCEALGQGGAIQAEIGLTTPQGGWMLVARSNRLEAAAPVGAAFLRAGPSGSAPPEGPGASAGAVEPMPAVASAASTAAPTDVPARVFPAEFPLVIPPMRAGGGARHPALASPPESAYAAVADANGAAVPMRDAPRAAIPAESPIAVTTPTVAAATGGAPAAAELGDVTASAAATASTADQPTELHALPGAVVPRLPPDLARLGAAPAAGSGPAYPAPVGGTDLRAELVVRGHAAPGTLLDLGGHCYRVGPGGRFELRVQVDDPALIMALLAQLPSLPVATRDADDGSATA